MLDNGLSFEILIKYLFLAIIVLILIASIHFAWFRYLKKQEIAPNFMKYILIIIELFLAGFIIFAVYDILAVPHVVVMQPQPENLITQLDTPIYAIFNRPLDANKIKPYIYPEIEGTWELEALDEALPFIKRKLVFYPKYSLPLNQKVFIYYAGIANAYNTSEPWEFQVDAKTAEEITAVTVQPENNAIDIMTDNISLSFSFDQPSGNFYKWDIEFIPAIKNQIYITDNNVSVSIQDYLSQSTTYSYILKGTPAIFQIADPTDYKLVGDTKELFSGSFTTVREPLIDLIEPIGSGVLVDTPIKIVFEQEMQTSNLTDEIVLSPEVKTEMKWIDEKTIELNHDNFEKNSEYTVVIKKGLRSFNGGVLENEITSNFKTIGYVEMQASSPLNNSSSINTDTNISVTFNQDVDHASAQAAFSISPSVSGGFSWNGKTMTYNPSSNLAYKTTYTVKLNKGIKSILGLDSKDELKFSFVTKEEYFKLNVPVYYQKLRFSCNIEAARMALAYRGIYKDVLTLYGQIAKDSTPYDEAANTFGNPYQGYTGDIYGVTKGYGVYWQPISSLISKYRSNSIKTGWNVSGLLDEVKAGNPVVIWAHNGYSYAGDVYYWTTPSGTSIRAVSGMHSYVVVGYKGTSSNPTHIILNDSNRGVWTVSISYFNSLWGYFNNSGVVVY